MWMLLHGFTGGPSSWSSVVERAALDTEPSVPFLAGHGPSWREYGVERFEDEVDRLAALASSLRPPRYVAGYSLGGRVALGMLSRHRGLFDAALLVSTHPGLSDAAARRERRELDRARAHKLRTEGLPAFVAAWEKEPLFASQQRLPTEVVAAQRDLRLAHDANGLAHALEVVGLGAMPSYREAVGSLEVPTTLMAGDQDLKFRELAVTIAEASSAVQAVIVPGAGHNLLLEATDVVADRLRRMEQEGR